MARSECPERGYDFFRDCALNGKTFTFTELKKATGWSEGTIKTYRSKQWKELFKKVGKGRFQVGREFLRLSKAQFLDHSTQRRPLFAKYKRSGYDSFVMFDFLIPLTRESELRAALDELFYADTVVQRLQEIDVAQLEKTIVRLDGESPDAYIKRVSRLAARFCGYSVTHVSGRFRAADLLSRDAALAHQVDGGKYLIDETTALVRFIIPCECTMFTFPDTLYDFGTISPRSAQVSDSLKQEVALIRQLFFLLFVEMVVRTIKGEDQIWLIEHGVEQQLYVWEKIPS